MLYKKIIEQFFNWDDNKSYNSNLDDIKINYCKNYSPAFFNILGSFLLFIAFLFVLAVVSLLTPPSKYPICISVFFTIISIIVLLLLLLYRKITKIFKKNIKLLYFAFPEIKLNNTIYFDSEKDRIKYILDKKNKMLYKLFDTPKTKKEIFEILKKTKMNCTVYWFIKNFSFPGCHNFCENKNCRTNKSYKVIKQIDNDSNIKYIYREEI